MLSPPPPRDSEERVVPHNHSEIQNGDFLVRGIPQHQIINGRISSGAFSSSTKNDPYYGMSVDLEKLSAGNSYRNDIYACAVKFKAQIPREKEALVGYDPLKNNIAHSGVWRVTPQGSKRLSGSQTKAMHSSAKWHVELPNTKIFR